MTREHLICFDLGFRVDDRTEFYNTLELKLNSSDSGVVITASQLNALHDQLKAHLGIVKDYPWYIRVVNVYRM